MTTSTKLDPITFAVVRNGLISAALEMYWVYKRTTMLPVLYEYNDFGMSIYDDRLNLVAEAPGLPIFSGSLDDCIERTLAEVGGAESLAEGDILLNNHPYLTAGQPADASLIEPIFHGGKLIGFGALRAHMGDLGAKGPYPTNSTEIYQEGILFPGIHLYREGVLDEVVIKILKANSRIPAETAGNVLAGAGALRAGSRVLRQLVDKYGLETYYSTIDELLDHGERVAREGIAAIPDGEYSAEDYIDDDGITPDVPVKVVCKVTIDGSDMIIDTTGSAPEQLGPINCPWGYTLCTGRFSLKRLVTPDIPPNGGEQRALKVIAPEGSLFNPVPPCRYVHQLGHLAAPRGHDRERARAGDARQDPRRERWRSMRHPRPPEASRDRPLLLLLGRRWDRARGQGRRRRDERARPSNLRGDRVPGRPSFSRHACRSSRSDTS